jgi:hypothetical protein
MGMNLITASKCHKELHNIMEDLKRARTKSATQATSAVLGASVGSSADPPSDFVVGRKGGNHKYGYVSPGVHYIAAAATLGI